MPFLLPGIVYWVETLLHRCDSNAVFVVDVSRAVAILRGSLGGPWPPQIFAWPPVWPRSVFFDFPFKFVWLTYAGLPNAFCKNTGHFANSARSELCRSS